MMSDERQRRAVLASLLMGAAAATSQALVPTKRLSDIRGVFALESAIPETFGSWRTDRSAPAALVNPETEALLNRTYTTRLERVYVGPNGLRMMLSVAYGSDQSDPSVQLHYPEVCYPAQGFKVLSNHIDTVQAHQGKLVVRRLETNYAEQRPEPVTYWTMVGDVQSLDGTASRFASLRHSLRGEIVDGVLVRLSTIDPDSATAFKQHDQFITALLDAMQEVHRRRLAGI